MRYSRWLIAFLMTLLLVIPLAAQETEAGTHVVQTGENLFRIALRYGLTTDELAAANDITNTSQIYAGQLLVIPGLEAVDNDGEVANPLVAAAPVVHIVQRGEYLGQIARLYNVAIDDILTANSIAAPDRIFPGQALQIWTDDISVALSDEDPTTEIATSAPDETSINDVVHIVQRGEYLSSIARSYGVSWTVIAERNNIVDPNDIDAGTTLIIPNVVGAEASNLVASVPTIAQNLPDPGAHWGVGREIVVDLSTQMTYAYDDGNLVFSSLVSTGLPATPTVQGEYSIWHRTPAQTMSGPGYYLPNVQWVMYFYQGYGFHGTYWHNNFGNPMSHGCVNMTNEDAEWLYNFASIGTNVWVQY